MVGRLPSDFEQLLAGCVAPGEEPGVALVIEAAARAGDDRLAGFLDSLAERIRLSPAPLRAAEVRALLRAGDRG